mmetsp:Transcript_53741/g.156175  ORF Transcript_53741/g.156175 Transcript_53741/m.156175 type:complete len:221 (+) Transcript_53741:731-1393(+)
MGPRTRPHAGACVFLHRQRRPHEGSLGAVRARRRGGAQLSHQFERPALQDADRLRHLDQQQPHVALRGRKVVMWRRLPGGRGHRLLQNRGGLRGLRQQPARLALQALEPRQRPRHRAQGVEATNEPRHQRARQALQARELLLRVHLRETVVVKRTRRNHVPFAAAACKHDRRLERHGADFMRAMRAHASPAAPKLRGPRGKGTARWGGRGASDHGNGGWL